MKITKALTLFTVIISSTFFVHAKDFTHLLKDDKCAYPTLDEKMQLGCPWIFKEKPCDENIESSVKIKQKTEKNDNLITAQWKLKIKDGFNKITYSGLSKYIIKKYNNEDYAFWYSGKVNCNSTVDGLCNMMKASYQRSIETYTGKPYYQSLWETTHEIETDQAENFALNAPDVIKQLMASALMLDVSGSHQFAYSDLQEKWAAMFLGSFEYNLFGIKNECCIKTTIYSKDGSSKIGNKYEGYYCGDTTSSNTFTRASCKQGDLYFAGDKFATLEWGQSVEPPVICVSPNFKCPEGRYLAEYKYGKQKIYACVKPPQNAHFETQLKRITCDNNFSNHEYRNCESEFCDDNSNDLMLKCIPNCPNDEYLDYKEEKCKALPTGAHKIDEYTWECDKNLTRHNDKDECRPWPKNAEPSKGCWFSSVRISDLSSKNNECPDYIELDGNTYYCSSPIDEDNNCTLTDCLKKLGEHLRAPLGTEVIFNFSKEKISVKMKQNFTQNEYLGKWSGCWKCPKGTFIDVSKNECVPK